MYEKILLQFQFNFFQLYMHIKLIFRFNLRHQDINVNNKFKILSNTFLKIILIICKTISRLRTVNRPLFYMQGC